MKKIAIFTSARSDYGPLKNIIKCSLKYFDTYILATGSHFLESSGYSLNEIVADGLVAKDKIIKAEIEFETLTKESLTKFIGLMQISFSQILKHHNFDGIIILGDRYELFGISVAAVMFSVPLFHISGGEVTEGAIDDSIRHAHTKLAHLHFVATDEYAENVSSMGEEDWRIIVSGESGLDNMHNLEYANRADILQEYGIDLDKDVFLITYHPCTLELGLSSPDQIQGLLKVLSNFKFKDIQKVFTAPAPEEGAELITEQIEKFVKKQENSFFVKSFGSKNYLTIMKNSSLVIGNSSSGIVEAPSFNVPSINIGNRQKNRICADSVLHTHYSEKSIQDAIDKVLSGQFQQHLNGLKNPYDSYADGKNSERIVYAINEALSRLTKEKLLVKKFDTKINPKDWDFLLRDFK